MELDQSKKFSWAVHFLWLINRKLKQKYGSKWKHKIKNIDTSVWSFEFVTKQTLVITCDLSLMTSTVNLTFLKVHVTKGQNVNPSRHMSNALWVVLMVCSTVEISPTLASCNFQFLPTVWGCVCCLNREGLCSELSSRVRCLQMRWRSTVLNKVVYRNALFSFHDLD